MGIDLSVVDNIVDSGEGYLLGTIAIAGVPHHVSMIEVVQRDGSQKVASYSKVVDSMLHEIRRFDNAEAAYRTVTYNDKNYVIVITPYCV